MRECLLSPRTSNEHNMAIVDESKKRSKTADRLWMILWVDFHLVRKGKSLEVFEHRRIV